MKNLLKLFLIVGCLLSSSAVFAKDGDYAGWSPGDLHQEAVMICDPAANGALFYDASSQACQSAVTTCSNNFKLCIMSKCESYTGYYQGNDDANFYTCTDAQIAECKATAASESSSLTADGGVCAYNSSKKSDDPNSHVRVATIGSKTPGNPILPGDEPDSEDHGTYQPQTPEIAPATNSGHGPKVETVVTEVGGTEVGRPEVRAIPNFATGSGCSLSIVSQGGLNGLLFGFIVLLPALRMLRKRK